MNNEFPMTPLGKAKLDEELDNLVRVEREEIKVAIAEARALGDLKENAEYHAAKEKQSHIEGRILQLQAKCGRSKVINPGEIVSEKIVFGATVTLFDIDKDSSLTLQIVGEDQADTKNGMISYNSPIAKAIIGREEGDEVIVKAPKGNISYEVEKVEYK